MEGAAFAREIVKAGGTYRLVLGKRLEANEIEDREAKLHEKAEELGFDTCGDRFKIIDGNQLARWIERFPALAVSRVIGSRGHIAIDFESWIRKDKHRFTWVPSAERDELRTTILAFLQQHTTLSSRIEGASGLGKSRGAMEALRRSGFEPLVVYVGDASEINSAVINHFARQNRSAVLVVDECDRQRHKVLAEQLESGSPVRLITIGQEDASWSQSQPLGLSKLPDDVIDKLRASRYALIGNVASQQAAQLTSARRQFMSTHLLRRRHFRVVAWLRVADCGHVGHGGRRPRVAPSGFVVARSGIVAQV